MMCTRSRRSKGRKIHFLSTYEKESHILKTAFPIRFNQDNNFFLSIEIDIKAFVF